MEMSSLEIKGKMNKKRKASQKMAVCISILLAFTVSSACRAI